MTFFSSIRSVFSKYATFSGRAGRPEFWWWTLFEYVTRGLLGAIYTVIMFDMIAPIIASGLRSVGMVACDSLAVARRGCASTSRHWALGLVRSVDVLAVRGHNFDDRLHGCTVRPQVERLGCAS
jgi:uncharacterized membrane protein YhaH (DUF805 family)